MVLESLVLFLAPSLSCSKSELILVYKALGPPDREFLVIKKPVDKC